MCDRLTVDAARDLLRDHPHLVLTPGGYFERRGSQVLCCALLLRVLQRLSDCQEAERIMEGFAGRARRWLDNGDDFRQGLANTIEDEVGYLAGLDNGFEGTPIPTRWFQSEYRQGFEDGEALREEIATLLV